MLPELDEYRAILFEDSKGAFGASFVAGFEKLSPVIYMGFSRIQGFSVAVATNLAAVQCEKEHRASLIDTDHQCADNPPTPLNRSGIMLCFVGKGEEGPSPNS